jgi:hypothetical protein
MSSSISGSFFFMLISTLLRIGEIYCLRGESR